jgi:hypothetical protein
LVLGILHGVPGEFPDNVSGPTVAPETSSGNSPCTLCKISKTKNQYSFHGESLKSRNVLAHVRDLIMVVQHVAKSVSTAILAQAQNSCEENLKSCEIMVVLTYPVLHCCVYTVLAIDLFRICMKFCWICNFMEF